MDDYGVSKERAKRRVLRRGLNARGAGSEYFGYVCCAAPRKLAGVLLGANMA